MLKKTPALASQGVSPPHILLLDPVLTIWDFCLQAASIPTLIKASNKGFHNIPTPPSGSKALQGHCLDKRCSILLGKVEATSHKRQEKNSLRAKRFLGQQIEQLPCQDREKGFDIQVLHPWQRNLLWSEQGREQERRKLQGEKRRQMLMIRCRTQCSFQSWRPNLMLHLILPKVLLRPPQPLFLIHTLP